MSELTSSALLPSCSSRSGQGQGQSNDTENAKQSTSQNFNSKGFDDDDDDDDEGTNINPLNIPNIVAKVMEFTTKAHLPTMRLVNKSWELEANKFIPKLKMLNFCATSQVPLFKSLSDLVLDAIYNPKLPHLLHNFNLSDFNPSRQPWLGFLDTFGPQLEILSITFTSASQQSSSSSSSRQVQGQGDGEGDGQDVRPARFYFGHILKSTPNLTYLCLDPSKHGHHGWTATEDGEDSYDLTSFGGFKLNHLKTFKLEVHCSRQTQHSSSSRRSWRGNRTIPQWEQLSGFWSLILNIVQISPNLTTFDICTGVFINAEILASLSTLTKVTTLSLGQAEEIFRRQVPRNICVRTADYLSILSSPEVSLKNLHSLKFPYPVQSSNPTWSKWSAFFSKIASTSTLVHLDIGEINYDAERGYNDRMVQPETWTQVVFNYDHQMAALRTLTVPIVMFSPELNQAKFPSLLHLSLVIDSVENIWRVFSAISEIPEFQGHFGEDLGLALPSLRKLTCQFDNLDGCPYKPIYEIFTILKNFMPNLDTVELKNNIGNSGLAAFLEVFGEEGSSGVGKIKVLRIENVRVLSGSSVNKFIRILTGVEEAREEDQVFAAEHHYFPSYQNSLKSFRNLTTFSFGLCTCMSILTPCCKIDRHFVRRSIRHLTNLKSLELKNFAVMRRALVQLKGIHGISHLDYSTCRVIDA